MRRAVAMRVAHVVVTKAFAGVERYVVNLANALAGRGIDVCVVGGSGDRMRSELDPVVSFWEGGDVLSSMAALSKGGRFDLVHAHMTKAELACSLALAGRLTPLVVTRHFAKKRGSSAAGKLAARWIRRRVELQISISEFVAAHIDGDSVVVYPGVPRLMLPDVERKPVVLVAQRLAAEKDTSTALRAFAASGLGSTGWKLNVAGEGPEEERLKEEAVALGIQASVDFLGNLREIDVRMAEASIFLATARAEPLGLSVLEAMRAATPVVASGSGGHLETVGRCGAAALFEPGDARRAASLLAELAANPDLRLEYGRELQAIQQERFSLESMVDRILALYEAAIQRGMTD